jgi:hypothetical protein
MALTDARVSVLIGTQSNADARGDWTVRVVAEATVDAMVAAFLTAEVGSSRFAARMRGALVSLGAGLDLVEHPDLTDPAANALRRRVLSAYRGFPDREVFTGVPANTRWQHVHLSSAELDLIRYIDWDWWLEVTGGSRRPADALRHYRRDRVCRAIASDIAAGRTLPPIIVVGRPGGTELVVLEGHLRLTAMLLVRSDLPPEHPAILGTSPDMST